MNEATEDSNNTPEGVQEDNSKDTQEQAAVQETAARHCPVSILLEGSIKPQ